MPWESVGDEIRHRLIDPAKFEDGSFRRIEIQKTKPRVGGIVGKLKGQKTMTLQALRFPLGDGWTVETAKAWVKEHIDVVKKEINMAEQKEVKRLYAPLEIKSLNEDGHFEGLCSTYGNTDLGGDIMEPGAFSKTIAEHGARLPLLAEHREAIGMSDLQDRPEGLYSSNSLNLAKSIARDAYADLKFYSERGIKMGMSIGYQVINAAQDKANDMIRHLTEVRIWENSITLFPMNQLARVTAVKSAEDDISRLLIEIKEGRMFSDANMRQMRDMLASHEKLIGDHTGLMEKFQALLEAGKPKAGAAKQDHAGPDDLHAALETLISLKGEIQWN
jgi:HK97 family phage prohead protease